MKHRVYVIVVGSNGYGFRWIPSGRPASYPRMPLARLSPRRVAERDHVAVAVRPSIGYPRTSTTETANESTSSHQQQQQQQQQR